MKLSTYTHTAVYVASLCCSLSICINTHIYKCIYYIEYVQCIGFR